MKKVIDLIKISTKKNPATMMIKTISMEKLRASLNFINVLQRLGGEWALGRSCVKSQKGESLFDGVEPTFYKGLMKCESMWRMLVFWMPHIHWRRLRNKVEEIPTDLVGRTCTEMHKAFESLKKLLKAHTSFLQLWRSCRTTETDQLRENIVDRPVDDNSNKLGVSMCILPEFLFCFKLNSDFIFTTASVFRGSC